MKTMRTFTGILAACFLLLLLPGCRNPFDSRDISEDGTLGTGTLSLTIATLGRTIMPEIGLWDFAEFSLVFTNTYTADELPSKTLTTGDLVDGTSTIELPTGIWDLTVTAFLKDDYGNLLAVAKGYDRNILVPSGGNVNTTVTLIPIPDGTGMLKWNLDFAPNITTASMEIRRWDNGDLYRGPFHFRGETPATDTSYSIPMDAGKYRVFLTMHNGREEVTISEILHVYTNMTSVFDREFDNLDFPVTLLHFILDAWNGDTGTWNFDARTTAAHFTALGIHGTAGVDIASIAYWFNRLSFVGGVYENVDDLKILFDAALIGMARSSIGITSFANRTAVWKAIADLPQNGAETSGHWPGNNMATVSIGVYGQVRYEVEIHFANPIRITVTFDPNNGNVPFTQDLFPGGTATMPDSATGVIYMPTVPGLFRASGVWRIAPYAPQFNFATPITNDITLTADWGVPYRIEAVAANNISMAVSFVNAPANPVGEYILAINTDLSIPQITLNRSGVTLTIIGLGGERQIRPTSPGGAASAHFMIGPNPNVTMILGNNITLMGLGPNAIPSTPANNNHLVRVNSGGTLIMNTGSRITGNTNTNAAAANIGGGVRVNTGGTFTMNGGIISNNTASGSSVGAGVHLAGGTFAMNGGEISGNTAAGAATSAGGVTVLANSTFTMRGGKISGNTSFRNGGGVGVGASMFTMYDGVISGNEATGSIAGGGDGGGVHLSANGRFTMHGGTIYGNTANNVGGGVNILPGDFSGMAAGIFTMYGGEIIGNTARNGGGVNVNPGNPASVPGIPTPVPSTFAMHGGRIYGNTAHNDGGGVNINFATGTPTTPRGVFAMYGGEIASNTAGWVGGGVNVLPGGTVAMPNVLEMRGGEITGNTAEWGGGGVYATGSTGVFRISNGVIHGNDSGHLGNATTGIGASLYSVGIAAQRGIFNNDSFFSLGSLYTTDLTIEVRNGLLLRPEGGFQPPEMSNRLATELERLRGVAQSGGTYVIYLYENEAITSAQASLAAFADRGGITIILRGSGAMRTVRLSGTGNLFAIGSDVTLVLDENVFLRGVSGNTGSLVNMTNGGTLIMNEGTRIAGNTNIVTVPSPAVGGGGVRVGNGGAFIMNGGIVSNNETSNSNAGGGGVLVAGGTFHMNDGEISSNRADCPGRGGGIRVIESGTFIMNGGTISNNWTGCPGGYGGGVAVTGIGSTFDMRGGEISGNTAVNNGGGVAVVGATFRMSNGVIHGNEASVPAGLRNTAGGNGASLNGTVQFGRFNGDGFAPSGTLSTSDLTIRVVDGVLIRPERGGNLATQLAWLRAFAQSGSNYTIYINDNETITPAQTMLPTGRNNLTITLRGIGGIRNIELPVATGTANQGSLFTVGSGVTLVLGEDITLVGRSGTTAALQNNNHLLRVNYGGTLIMNMGSRITGNINSTATAADGGGGVRVNSGGVFILDGGEISGNSATNTVTAVTAAGHGGGVRVEFGGRFDMLGGTIFGNTGQFGGGVRVSSGGTFRMSGGVIYGNTVMPEYRRNISRGTGVNASASLSNVGGAAAAQHGTFNNGVFSALGNLGTTNITLYVRDGRIELTGTVSITGTAFVGRTLTANTGALGGSGAISFQWMRGGSPIDGANDNTYIVQAADEGYTITVTVTRTGNFGSITSTPTAPVIAFGYGTFTITFAQIQDMAPTIPLPQPISLSNPTHASTTISVSPPPGGGFHSINWYFDGATPVPAGTVSLDGTTLTLDARIHRNQVRTHFVTVEVEIGGRLYSRVITFSVVP